MKKERILFLHGRKPNPVHLEYADCIGAKKLPVDFFIKWQDEANPFKWKVYLSWIICTLVLSFKKFDVIIVESFREPAIFLKLLGLAGKRKMILFLTNETTYMVANNRLSPKTTRLYKTYLNKVDGIICISEMVKSIALTLLSDKQKPVQVIINGVDDARFGSLADVAPAFDKNNILIIANGSGPHRIYCKGMDIMLDIFGNVKQVKEDSELFIIGNWDEASRTALFKNMDQRAKKAIHFVGFTTELEKYITQCAIYLHIARGESWGISILEAMRAGMIPLVSEWTGAKEVVGRVDQGFVLPLNKKIVAEKVIEVFNLTLEDKISISRDCRLVSDYYTQEAANASFMSAVNNLLDKFQINDHSEN